MRAETGDDEEHRHHRDVLGEQHRKAAASHGGSEASLLRQELHDNGRRRERQAAAEDHGCLGGVAERPRDGADDETGQQDLRGTHPEYHASHSPEPFERKLQPDHEQQKHHAELGERAYPATSVIST